MTKKLINKQTREQIIDRFNDVAKIKLRLGLLEKFIRERQNNKGWVLGDICQYYHLLADLQGYNLSYIRAYGPAYAMYVECSYEGQAESNIHKFELIKQLGKTNMNWLDNLTHFDDRTLKAVKDSAWELNYQGLGNLCLSLMNTLSKYQSKIEQPKLYLEY